MRDLDQALIELAQPKDGSLAVRSGLGKGKLEIAIFVVSFLGCVVLNRIEGKAFMSGEALFTFGWFAIYIIYALRSPARDQTPPNVPQES